MKKTRFLTITLAALSVGVLTAHLTLINKDEHHHDSLSSYLDEDGNLTQPIDIAINGGESAPKEKYEENVVLVKTFNDIDETKIDLDILSIEELYQNSPWKKITLNGTDAFDAVCYLRDLGIFEHVDYNYVMETEDIGIESIDISSNPYADQLPYIESNGVGNAWAWGHYKHNNDEEEIDAGGSPDVVIAIIDTGVDYNHVDLRNNIWTNTAEIPNNGIDDDNNGYIDDIRGWDCVNEDNDPMDDNGHGTHVAGIAAAENNDIGTIGVAFNCKIMPIKAGNSSGSFTNADIAQAIQYAYMNGASIINMSFGGSSISIAVEDALRDAYHQCVLVAAAGNNNKCNQPLCPIHDPKNVLVIYPGALPYVVGVMSCNANGTNISTFSNYDHAPYHYNQYEYDCYACGEEIISTWPGNKYARLSGTSMSSPVVSGIAALLRSAYPDRETFSNKFIHSQLTNTGTINPSRDKYHPLCDAYAALTRIPTPHIYNLYRFYAFDNEEFSPNNNGDGFIDAGETIRLGIELQNRGGKAKNVTAKIDTMRDADPDLTDPNVNIVADTIHMDDIGTYSIQDGGKIYEDGKVINMTNAFVIEINPNTQNGYECDINLHLEYYNGLDDSDHTRYIGDGIFSIAIISGTRLSGTITEDTTFTANKLYVIDSVLNIAYSATVTFEEGCIIEFYSNSAGYIDTLYNSPEINVYGTLNFIGTEEKKIEIRPTSAFDTYGYYINHNANGNVNFVYANITNCCGDPLRDDGNVYMSNCTVGFNKFTFNGGYNWGLSFFEEGNLHYNGKGTDIKIMMADSCYFDFSLAVGNQCYISELSNSTVLIGSVCTEITISSSRNNLFLVTNREIGTSMTGFELSINYYYGKQRQTFENNVITLGFIPEGLKQLTHFTIEGNHFATGDISGNVFADIYQEQKDVMISGLVSPTTGSDFININDLENHNDSVIWPYIKDISILDENENIVRTVGTEKNTVRVTFSREMDMTNDFSLFYGSWDPYADYEIKGDYVSGTVWEGELQVKANIEGGIQYFSSKGGCASDDSFKTLVDNAGAFTFNIDTSSAFAMNLQANPTEQGVELTWVQDDYDTLMGYNIYRSESEDGNYARLNSSIIPAGENTFLDDSCEPGKAYWYTFTVVLSDFSESAPAGKVTATPIDTISPTIYHNPVNQGYANNNLVISCTASDNIAVTSATLYYRTVGEENWKSLPMAKLNDRFSATIFGSEVTMAGLEYYISVTDGRNVVTRGSVNSPYKVIVKDASLLNDLGDVDGDGSITTKDALMIIRAINDELILTDDQFHRADLNKDGVLNTFEALRILQYINGNVTSVDMSEQ